MVTLFGTDGVRGLVNSTLMPELAYQLGRAAGAYFCKSGKSHRFLIGMDTRVSGPMLTAAISAGLCASGIDVPFPRETAEPLVGALQRVEAALHEQDEFPSRQIVRDKAVYGAVYG